MPQSLSKCMHPSDVLTSTPACGDGRQDKTRTGRNRKRFKCQKKTDEADHVQVQVQAETAHVCREEDWELEIEEFSRWMEEKKEKERSNLKPYDAEEELKVALCEMSLYSVPHAPRRHQQHYDPSTHHTPPVKWVCKIPRVVTDQFADAEE